MAQDEKVSILGCSASYISYLRSVGARPARILIHHRRDLIKAPRGLKRALVGERDLTDSHKAADILNKKIRHSRRMTLRGAGHLSPTEAREFHEAVMDFLANV